MEIEIVRLLYCKLNDYMGYLNQEKYEKVYVKCRLEKSCQNLSSQINTELSIVENWPQ